MRKQLQPPVFCLYTVMDRDSGKILVKNKRIEEAAAALGVSRVWFRNICSRDGRGSAWAIKSRKFRRRYTVYKNKTDELVILDGTAREAAEAMGISFAGFYSIVTRSRGGKIKKWHVDTRWVEVPA